MTRPALALLVISCIAVYVLAMLGFAHLITTYAGRP